MGWCNLGPEQRELLTLLDQRPGGTWSAACGWRHGTASNIDVVLSSLIRYGLVERTSGEADGFGVFHITDLGREKAMTLRRRR